MYGKVYASNGELTFPSQVDNDLLMFHWVGDSTGWHRVLSALMDEDHQTTATVLSYAAAISAPTLRVKARDLWHGILLAELRFLDQRHVNFIAFQDDCKFV